MNLPYTYFIRNRVTGQFYYGSRCKNVALNRSAKEDFWIHYFTSSKKVKNLITEYGKDSFDFEIIMESETFDDCYWKEQELISSTIFDSLSLNGYFVDKITGKNKFSTSNKSFGPLSKEHRLKISNSLLGKSKPEGHGDSVSRALAGKPKSEATKSKMSAFQNSRPKVKCEHCGKETNLLNFQNWHGDKCKLAVAAKEQIFSMI